MSRNWQHQKMLNSRNKVVSTLPIEGSLVALNLVYFPVSYHLNNEVGSNEGPFDHVAPFAYRS